MPVGQKSTGIFICCVYSLTRTALTSYWKKKYKNVKISL